MAIEFASNGLDPVNIEDEVRRAAAIEHGISGLLRGFLALGLFVGLAGIAILTMRAIEERRQQIGILSAIGTQPGAIQLSFLLEVAFLVSLGSTLGVGLGLVASYNYTVALNTIGPSSLVYRVPWLELGGIVLLCHGASSLSTFWLTSQISRLYPAEVWRSASGFAGPTTQKAGKAHMRPMISEK